MNGWLPPAISLAAAVSALLSAWFATRARRAADQWRARALAAEDALRRIGREDRPG